MFFKNWKIKHKLLLLVVVNMMFLVVIGTVGFSYLNKIAEASEEMYKDRLIPVKELMVMRGNYRSVASSSLELLMATDEKRKRELENTITDSLQHNNVIIAEYEKTKPSGSVKESFEELKKVNVVYEKGLKEVIEINKTTGSEEAYAYANEHFTKARIAVGENADKLVELNVQAAEQTNKMNHSNKQQASIITITLTIAAIIISIVISFIIMKFIIKPLREIQELMEFAEQGDFTKQGSYQSRDEMGLLMSSFNRMLNGLKKLILEVAQKSEQVAASSEELAAGAEMTSKATEHIANTIQGLVVGTDRQMNSVSETVMIMNEMSTGVHQATNTSQNIADASVVTSDKAREGYGKIAKAIQQMNSISETVHGLGGMIQNLGDRSREIGLITNVITEISTQTNLLALNAAIEAARAGEHGRGFSVVADEVKKLAERTTESAQQITQLIDSIQNETQLAVSSMSKASTEVAEGIVIVNNAGESFEQIEHGIKEVSNNMLEVSAAAQQIAASTDNVKHSINVVSEVADLTLTGTEEVSSATEEQLASMQEIASTSVTLSKIAEQLQMLIAKFKV